MRPIYAAMQAHLNIGSCPMGTNHYRLPATLPRCLLRQARRSLLKRVAHVRPKTLHCLKLAVHVERSCHPPMAALRPRTLSRAQPRWHPKIHCSLSSPSNLPGDYQKRSVLKRVRDPNITSQKPWAQFSVQRLVHRGPLGNGFGMKVWWKTSLMVKGGGRLQEEGQEEVNRR
jgi:hypothetical protein